MNNKLIHKLNALLAQWRHPKGCRCWSCETIKEAIQVLATPSGSTSAAKEEQRLAFGKRKEYKRW